MADIVKPVSPAKKSTKPKVPAAHPPFAAMISAAIKALKDRTGSSRQAILKYICANYKVDANKAGVHLRMALKRGVTAGTLKMAKESGKGASSYKLGEKAKEDKKPKAKKPTAKKDGPKKAAAKKKTVGKKTTAKKATDKKKTATKKAADIKKPAAKKPTANKTTEKKPATKKPAVKKTAAKKPATKKPATKKPTAKKSTIKK